jgi:hypothetical protein
MQLFQYSPILHNLFPKESVLQVILFSHLLTVFQSELLSVTFTNLYFGSTEYKTLIGKPEVERPLERPRCRWEDNIKLDLREAGFWGGGVWIGCIRLRIGADGGIL